jgi:NodT family efflux transporter outer membrane factor (OMF) lipoprotein
MRIPPATKAASEAGTLRRLAKVAASATILAALTACTVGPDYTRPTAVVPPVFKEMSGWKVAQPNDRVQGPWWEVYNDTLLNELEAKVGVSNQNVKVAEAQFRQAHALVMAARSAYFPAIGIGASFSRLSPSATLGTVQPSRTVVSNYSLPLSLSWELDIWGRIRRSVESSQANAQAGAADLAAAKLSIQAELAQDYFQLRALDAQKRLLDSTVALYQEALKLTTSRYDAGLASMADVAQAETLLKTTQAQAIDIGVQRAQFEHAVAVLTGTPASSFSLPAEALHGLPPAIPAGVPSELLERRPDIAAAERRVAAANAQIGVAEAAYYPTITLGASGGYQSTDIDKWLSWPSRFWSFGPAVSQSLFDGGLRRAQTEEARAAYDANVAAYRETTLVSFQEVEDNLAALRVLEEEARAQEEAVKAAQQSLTITANQYKAGTVGYLNVIAAQTAKLVNDRSAIDILGRRLNASVLLIKALGGGWDSSELPQAKDLSGKK